MLHKFRLKYLTIIVLIILIVIITFYFWTTIRSNSHTITLTENGYTPEELTITRGTTVTFISSRGEQHWPASDEHPIHTAYPEFDAKQPIAASEEWSFTFNEVGTWHFHDHLRSYFHGTIHVTE